MLHGSSGLNMGCSVVVYELLTVWPLLVDVPIQNGNGDILHSYVSLSDGRFIF